MPERLYQSPAGLLAHWRGTADDRHRELQAYEAWWQDEGCALSAAVDRQGTPPLHMHDRWGRPIDRVAYGPDYRRMLERGYAAGVVSETANTKSLLPAYRLGYVTSFFDPGLYCPYTVSLGTLVPLLKYADDDVRTAFVPGMARRDGSVQQGATWMTEAGGGSDLGHNVQTRARAADCGWRLDGEKYFCSNVNADLAVVAARPEGAADGVRGLALFLVPRYCRDGGLNYRIRRLKDKIATRSVPTGEVEFRAAEAYLLGQAEQGIYLIMEVLNTSRVANSVGAAAVVQRALAEALTFATSREVFGQPLLEQPLFREQARHWSGELRSCFALAWAAADQLESVWQQQPPYSDDYHLFRLLAHLAKFHTAERAVDAARWAMEVHGGAGVLHEYPVERLLREAMILGIWEGTPHRQMLDGLEVMQRGRVHESLFAFLGEPAGSDEQRQRIEALLARDTAAEREAGVEPVFRELARWTAQALAEQALAPLPDPAASL